MGGNNHDYGDGDGPRQFTWNSGRLGSKPFQEDHFEPSSQKAGGGLIG